jgi:acyl carrier protein
MQIDLTEITKSIVQIVSEVLQIPLGDLSADFLLSEQPNWDSLAQLETLLLVEEKFGIEFPVSELAKISTVSEFARIVKDI